MPTYTNTVRHALRRLTGTNVISDIDAGIAALADDIDAKMAIADAGTLAARPVSTAGTPGILGRFYRVTDPAFAGQIHFDYGTGWITVDANDPRFSDQRAPKGPETNLKVIRGNVNADGTITAGSGFTTADGGGSYRQVNFTSSFSGTPSVTVSWTDGNPEEIAAYNLTTAGFAVYGQTGGGAAVLKPFSFIALGPA